MDKDELEASLAEKRGEGQFQGEGSFTIDTAKASSSLQSFMLENPRSYVLSVLAYGVASGATQIDMAKDRDDFIFTHNGLPLEAEQLQSLFTIDPQEPPSQALSELGLGLRAALALSPKWLKVSSGDHCLSWSEGSCELQAAPSSVEGVRIHVKESLSFRDLFKGTPEESLLLRDRCCYAPLALTLNREDLRRAWLPNSGLIGELLSGPGLPERERVENRFQLPVQDFSHSLLSGLVYLHREARQAETRIVIVLCGVSFEIELDLGWPGSGAVLFCSHLKKDLSQNALVEDESFLAILEFLRERFSALAGKLASYWSQITKTTQNSRIDLLKLGLQHQQKTDDWSGAVSSLTHLLAFTREHRGEDHPDTYQQYQGLARALAQNGEVEKAAALLREQAERAERSHDFQSHLGLLSELHTIVKQGAHLHRDTLLDMWRKLAVAQARAGLLAESQDSVESLREALGEEPDSLELLQELQEALKSVEQTKVAVGPRCSRCGGSRLMWDCPLLGDKNRTIRVRLAEPTSFLLASEFDVPLKATVCGDCGHVELSIDKARELWDKRNS